MERLFMGEYLAPEIKVVVIESAQVIATSDVSINPSTEADEVEW